MLLIADPRNAAGFQKPEYVDNAISREYRGAMIDPRTLVRVSFGETKIRGCGPNRISRISRISRHQNNATPAIKALL